MNSGGSSPVFGIFLVLVLLFFFVIVPILKNINAKEKAKEDERLAKLKAERLEEERKEREKMLIEKYGEEKAKTFIAGKVYIGMTMEEFMDSVNKEPTKIETEVLKTKTKVLLIYGYKSSGDVFVFVNDKLESFKDR